MRGHHGVGKAIPRQNCRVVDHSLSLYPVGTKTDSSLFSPLAAGKPLLPAAALPAFPSCSVVATMDTGQTHFTEHAYSVFHPPAVGALCSFLLS